MSTMAILAFDVYGTLLDLGSIGIDPDLLREWRSVQLEMTWRSTLMGIWIDFDEITRLSLKYVANRRKIDLDEDALLKKWEQVEPYEDAKHVCILREKHEPYVLTNGTRKSVEKLLKRAGIIECFRGIYTAEAVKKYKPAREIYIGFLNWAGAEKAFLVSSNPFDVAGAKNAGMGAIYVNRHGLPTDPLARPPDYRVTSIDEIAYLSI